MHMRVSNSVDGSITSPLGASNENDNENKQCQSTFSLSPTPIHGRAYRQNSVQTRIAIYF